MTRVTLDTLDPSTIPGAHDHEEIVVWHDPATGLRAAIALHSTALGPGLGGTRFHPYPTFDDALADVVNLSRAMSYKNSLAGLPHGGGKAVIWGDPARDKTPALLRSYGRFVDRLEGRYVTACDVGTYVADMDVVAETTRFATGRSPAHGGAGDSSVLTALGVYQGMRAAAEHTWGDPSLGGRHVGIVGVGKVGRVLAGHLVADGARVTVTDVDAGALDRLRQEHPSIQVAGSASVLAAMDLDVYAPCALGGALSGPIVRSLRARVVCGGANNQLPDPQTADALAARGVVYAPDYCVNSGGVIQVADELLGFDFERARLRTLGIFETTAQVLATASSQGITPAAAADAIALARMSAARRVGA